MRKETIEFKKSRRKWKSTIKAIAGVIRYTATKIHHLSISMNDLSHAVKILGKSMPNDFPDGLNKRERELLIKYSIHTPYTADQIKPVYLWFHKKAIPTRKLLETAVQNGVAQPSSLLSNSIYNSQIITI